MQQHAHRRGAIATVLAGDRVRVKGETADASVLLAPSESPTNSPTPGTSNPAMPG
jgi:hypothetical protein